ncbi:protein sneaky [Onthophagus taurus]|uniref:protein sneaky n=1 Tax=Onthophagus taurus TaxID=166361 RepID=UPI000C2068CA|nr:E3 ubiquitin-protein ligase DCST1 [Onthophagus taurus]
MSTCYCPVDTRANRLERKFRCIHKLFQSEKDEHVALKRVCGFIYGVLLGLGFYELILVDLNFTENAAYLVGGVICLMLGFGIAFSSQIRCISLLSIPNFVGRSGRSVLKALVFAYIISGPIHNLTENGKEVVRVFGCTTSLTFNLTKTRFELMFKPFTQALFGMKTDANEIKDTLRTVKDVSAPITGELEDDTEVKKMKEENDYMDAKIHETKRNKELDKKYNTIGEKVEATRMEKEYLKKIELRCQNQFNKAGKKCKDMFGKAYDTCYDAVTWIAAWLLCWPMKLTFVCNIVEALGGKSKCDPAKDIDHGFGEGYMYLKKTRSTFSENFKNVKLQYRIGKIHQIAKIREATDTAKEVMHIVQRKKSFLESIMVIVKRVLAFIFLKIILDSQKYHDKYLRDIEFDNIYITRYFRKIDARRRREDKKTLLPLKKIERNKLVDPWNLKPLKDEREKLFGKTFKLLLEMITATTFILLDRLFYEALDLVRRHAHIDYYQTGHHDMMLQIKGTGMIATLLRSLVKGFNVKKRIRAIRSNAACLPQPTILPQYYIYKIYGTYFAVWVAILCEAYILRLRRLICSYFYRKREKKRVLFLYNETLKRRIGFFRYMKKKVRKMVRKQRLENDLNVCAVLRIRFPNFCSCLKMFPMARRKCIICGDPEPRKKSNIPGNFEKCKTPDCYVVHCVECWNDVGRVCFACSSMSPDTTDLEDSDENLFNFD